MWPSSPWRRSTQNVICRIASGQVTRNRFCTVAFTRCYTFWDADVVCTGTETCHDSMRLAKPGLAWLHTRRCMEDLRAQITLGHNRPMLSIRGSSAAHARSSQSASGSIEAFRRVESHSITCRRHFYNPHSTVCHCYRKAAAKAALGMVATKITSARAEPHPSAGLRGAVTDRQDRGIWPPVRLGLRDK